MARTHVFNSGKNEPNPKELDLTFGMFFDGTGNNKRNTEIRKKVQQVEEFKGIAPTKDEEKIYKKKALKFFSGKEKDNSYKSDFSNVARMNMCSLISYRIYTEGIGTEDKKGDNVFPGQALGTGGTGVLAKVQKGCESLAKKIKESLEKRRKTDTITVVIDSFGFSRGAAAARNFIYEIQKSSYSPNNNNGGPGTNLQTDSFGNTVSNSDLMDNMLPPFGHLGLMLKRVGVKEDLIKSLQLHIRFIGLYDTVASYGIKHSNDIKQLNLNSLGAPSKVVQFAAMNEERKKFPLTHIPFGIEKSFPGVHSDIGGGYDNNSGKEERTLGQNFSNRSMNNSLQSLKDKMIKEGWYLENEIKILEYSSFNTEQRLVGKILRRNIATSCYIIWSITQQNI